MVAGILVLFEFPLTESCSPDFFSWCLGNLSQVSVEGLNTKAKLDQTPSPRLGEHEP